MNHARWPIFVGLGTIALCAPFIRAVYWLGDEGVLLHAAARMLSGELLYVDFFEFLPPGGFRIMAAWFDIVGTTLASARVLAILTIAGIACFIFLSCRAVTRHAPSSAIVAIGWVMMSQGPLTQISHHWFTTFFTMVTIWAALSSVANARDRYREPLIAGLSAGFAAMVTPTRGALTMLAALTVFFKWDRPWNAAVIYVAAGLLIPVSLIADLWWNGTLDAAFDAVIVHTFSRYIGIQPVPFGFGADLQTLPLLFVWPLAFLFTLILCIQNWRYGTDDRFLRPCVAFGFAGLIGCYPRPDAAHTVYAVPMVAPLLVHTVRQTIGRWRVGSATIMAYLAMGVSILSPVAFLGHVSAAIGGDIAATPRGKLVYLMGQNDIRDVVAWIGTVPGEEKFFFYPYLPMLPFLTARAHASRYDIYTPGYTSLAQYRETCVSVLRGATWVVFDRRSAHPQFLKMAFPAMSDAAPPETRQFERALETGFAYAAKYGPFEVRRRTALTTETTCDAITDRP